MILFCTHICLSNISSSYLCTICPTMQNVSLHTQLTAKEQPPFHIVFSSNGHCLFFFFITYIEDPPPPPKCILRFPEYGCKNFLINQKLISACINHTIEMKYLPRCFYNIHRFDIKHASNMSLFFSCREH